MLTFKSRAAASVIMFDEVARQLLEIMGKSPDREGIITVEQLPPAIEALNRAAIEDRARGRAPEDEEKPAAAQAITLAQRAVPLIDMLKESLAAGKPVTWG